MLHGAGLRRPTGVHVHGFLNVDGQKMSKSRGTFITARRYLDLLPPDHLRYYFVAKLGSGLEDIDMNLEDFCPRELRCGGQSLNIASRCAPFIERAGGQLATALPILRSTPLFVAAAEPVAQLFENRDYAGAIREVMALADRANQYVDQQKPWIMAKSPERVEEARQVATQAINLFRVLMTFLSPVMPTVAAQAGDWLGPDAFTSWRGVETPLLGRSLAKYPQLATRIDPAIAKQLVAAPPAAPAETPAATAAPGKPVISIDDFARLDLRAALVLAANRVEGSDKLLQLTLDLGTEQRNVFSGISTSYEPEHLVGRFVVMIANLAPRKMRFGVSEGMVLCASGEGSGVFLLSADAGVAPGMKVS